MTIDGVNILTNYNGIISDESMKTIISYPSLKEPETNDWAEETGIEVDLSSPTLDKRNVSLAILCDADKASAFVDFLLLKTYRIYDFPELGCNYKFRFKGISNFDITNAKCTFTVNLIDDLPLFNYIYQAPTLNAVDYGCTIDAVNIKTFGVTILEGTYESLEGFSTVKNRLEIRNRLMSGVKVEEAVQMFSEYSATINCFMKQTIANFWIGYNALLYALAQPNLRTLVANGKTYQFYYKGCKIDLCHVSKGMIYCEFSIEIVIV